MSYQPMTSTSTPDLVCAYRQITARAQVASDRRRNCSSLDPAAARELAKAEEAALDDRRTAAEALRDRGHGYLATLLRREANALRRLRNSLDDVGGAGDGTDGLADALDAVQQARADVAASTVVALNLDHFRKD